MNPNDIGKFCKEAKMSFKQFSLAVLIVFCAIWAIGTTAEGADLIAHWPFDQDSGKEVKDVVGGHHGQVKGGDAAWVAGKFDNGLQIKGPKQYVEVKRAKELELKTLTLIAWIKLGSVAGRQEIPRDDGQWKNERNPAHFLWPQESPRRTL